MNKFHACPFIRGDADGATKSAYQRGRPGLQQLGAEIDDQVDWLGGSIQLSLVLNRSIVLQFYTGEFGLSFRPSPNSALGLWIGPLMAFRKISS